MYQEPIIKEDTAPKKFLRRFLEWLSNWAKMESINGKLTKATHTALHHTTHCLLEISDYCLNELGAKYVLLGKFQTDSLEARFGQYRQLAGGKYNVSLRQIYECEKKIRLLSVLKLSLKGKDITLEDFSCEWDNFESNTWFSSFPVTIDTDDVEKGKQYLPVLTYIAGYCCYSITKKLKCEECKERIVSEEGNINCLQHNMIRGLSRGKLLYPSYEIISIVLVSYLVVNKLTVMDEFYKESSKLLIQY